MKRLFADRPNWKRILAKRFYCAYLSSPFFTGNVSLLCMDQVSEQLWAKHGTPAVCIVDTGYSWLQHFPDNEHFSVTTMFDAEGQILQWYIDICLRNGVTQEGIPYLDDLYLDIVVFPNGEMLLLDSEELEHALTGCEITHEESELAHWVSTDLIGRLNRGEFWLFDLCAYHRKLLLDPLSVIYDLGAA
ncbi:MAG: DUF402 domain-containing protein [Caldilineaceae bacterium]|nr:DUF402 domain-containing protein [Caldilineaceae bacterium]